jgi:hypothetical protein
MDEASETPLPIRLPSPEEMKPRLMKLWPHRTHESNWLRAVICRLGWHAWYPMTLNDSVSGLRVVCTFCRRCTEVIVDDVQWLSNSKQTD